MKKNYVKPVIIVYEIAIENEIAATSAVFSGMDNPTNVAPEVDDWINPTSENSKKFDL